MRQDRSGSYGSAERFAAEPWRQLYDLPGWTRARRLARMRDGSRCRYAGCEETTKLETHHTRKLGELWVKHGGPLPGDDGWPVFVSDACDLAFLVTLCAPHHREADVRLVPLDEPPAGKDAMPTTKTRPAPKAAAASAIRDRIKEFKRVPAAELRDNERNWRLHPYAQRRAIAESLDQIGIADALLAYRSKRNGGKLTLIDGHARREEHEGDWPVLILDVTDEEADQLLLTLDPMTAMAEIDAAALNRLMGETVVPGTPALQDLLSSVAADAGQPTLEEMLLQAESPGPPEMELQAFEHYDYVMLLFRNALDWQRAKDLLGIAEAAFTLRDGVTRKIGLGRVVDGRRLFELVDQQERDEAELAGEPS